MNTMHNKIDRAIYDTRLRIGVAEREADEKRVEIKTLKQQLETLLAIEADKHTPHVVAECMDCRRAYGEQSGFPDLVVSPEMWERIMPGSAGGGLLCPSCLCARAHRADVECEAKFTSGPFATAGEKN